MVIGLITHCLQGWLRSIETVPTRQIPNLSAEANVGFNPWEQIGFGRDVLTWMQHMTGAHLVTQKSVQAMKKDVSCDVVLVNGNLC